jgi:hypothetical protein
MFDAGLAPVVASTVNLSPTALAGASPAAYFLGRR